MRSQDPVTNDGIVRVPRHVQHLRLRMLRRQLLGDLAPAHLGHHDIGDQKVDRSRMLDTQDLGFDPVACLQDGITQMLKHVPHEPPHLWFVLHQQHGLLSLGQRGPVSDRRD